MSNLVKLAKWPLRFTLFSITSLATFHALYHIGVSHSITNIENTCIMGFAIFFMFGLGILSMMPCNDEVDHAKSIVGVFLISLFLGATFIALTYQDLTECPIQEELTIASIVIAALGFIACMGLMIYLKQKEGQWDIETEKPLASHVKKILNTEPDNIPKL